MTHYYGSCPDLKYLLECEPTEVDNVLKCCGRPRLHHSLSEGLSEETLQLLIKGASVNIKDKDGQTALHVAITNKSINPYVVKMIAEKSSDINSKDKRGKAALHLAISCANSEALKTLFQIGANPDIEDCNGNSPLHYALPDHLDLVETLVKHGANVEFKNNRGETPLHKAAQAVEIRRKDKLIIKMKLLLDKGANVNAQTCNGETPLHLCVQNYYKGDCHRRCTFLLNNGAKVDLHDKRGFTPIHLAALYNIKIFTQMLETESGKTAINIPSIGGSYPLHTVARRRDINIVKLLLDNSAIIDSKNKYGETALHLVTEKRICSLLIERGASLNARDVNGMTPLHSAANNLNPEIMQLLLENGAEVNSKNKNGETPLHVAVREIFIHIEEEDDSIDNPQMVSCKTLLSNGALPNVKDKKGMTPLHYAMEYNNVDIIEVLIENGAEVNSKNKNGETPLHVAAREIFIHIEEEDDSIDNPQMVSFKTLLSNGALPNVKDDKGMTPLHYATEYNNVDIIEVLIENGADVNVKNNNGKTPLHISAVRKSVIIQTLNQLLQKGARVNEQDNNGLTALHNICYNKNMNCEKINMIELGIAQIFGDDSCKVLKLLEWGASQNIRDNFGKTPSDYFLYTNAQKEYDIKRTCLYLNCDIAKDVQKTFSVQRLRNSCNEEISRMKLDLFGNHSLYDIFRHYDDPHFLSNMELESAVQSENLEDKFPLYCSMLTSTYRRSKERVQLFHSVSAVLSTPLPFEVMRYILTFIDNDSLRNVIKAKEECP